MSIMKLMLPPVVSSGQYQMMESSMAMVEHIAMTDKAMIGPQWHSRLTSWMFSNVTIVDRNFIFTNKMTGQFSSWTIWNTRFLLCYLERSSVQAMHMFSLFFCLSCKQTDRSGLTWPFCLSLFFKMTNSSIPYCQFRALSLLTDWYPPSKRERKRKIIYTISYPICYVINYVYHQSYE